MEADDFDFSEEAVKEREDQIGKRREVTDELAGKSDDALIENVVHAADIASPLMQLPKVKVSQANLFGPSWIVERMVTVAERCLQIEPVFDRKGRPVGQFQFNPQGALKALELLGKTMAMFKDKVEITHELDAFSSGELDDRIKALMTDHPELANVIELKPDTETEGEA